MKKKKKYRPRGQGAAFIVANRLGSLEDFSNRLTQMVLYQSQTIQELQVRAMDWFSLPPKLRTKAKMAELMQLEPDKK